MSTQQSNHELLQDNFCPVYEAGEWTSPEEQYQYGCEFIESDGFSNVKFDDEGPADTSLMNMEFFEE